MADGAEADCIFCRIIAGEIPSTKVYDDAQVYAFRDLNPGAPTHVLIVPKRHVRDIADPAAEDGATLVAITHAANEVARQEGIDKSGYRLVWNVGPDAGQSVFHLHLHLLGGRDMAWPPG